MENTPPANQSNTKSDSSEEEQAKAVKIELSEREKRNLAYLVKALENNFQTLLILGPLIDGERKTLKHLRRMGLDADIRAPYNLPSTHDACSMHLREQQFCSEGFHRVLCEWWEGQENGTATRPRQYFDVDYGCVSPSGALGFIRPGLAHCEIHQGTRFDRGEYNVHKDTELDCTSLLFFSETRVGSIRLRLELPRRVRFIKVCFSPDCEQGTLLAECNGEATRLSPLRIVSHYMWLKMEHLKLRAERIALQETLSSSEGSGEVVQIGEPDSWKAMTDSLERADKEAGHLSGLSNVSDPEKPLSTDILVEGARHCVIVTTTPAQERQHTHLLIQGLGRLSANIEPRDQSTPTEGRIRQPANQQQQLAFYLDPTKLNDTGRWS